MKLKHRGKSISTEVRHSVSVITVLLTMPVIIGLIIMIMYSTRYQAMIQRMDKAAELKPALENSIAEDLFSVVAGRKAFENSGVMRKIMEIDRTLDELTAETSGNGHLQLTIARRTMETMEQYALRVRDGMEERKPVVEMEEVVDEVRDVGRLVANMLDNFVTEEIRNATTVSKRLHQWMWVASGAEIILLITALFLSRSSTDRMTGSIRTALSSVEKTVKRIAEGRFEERVTETDVEELQELGEHINEMADQLERLIRETRQKSDHLAKAELRTIQAQINPHFLYNTLDTINWMAIDRDEYDISNAISSLATILRYAIVNSNAEMSIKEETEWLKKYIYLQQFRMKDRFSCSLFVAPDIQEARIHKFLLQPFVENAIVHGFDKEREDAKLEISIEKKSDRLEIRIADNGPGMDPELMEKINSGNYEDGGSGTGIGLKNAATRLAMYYKKAGELHVEKADPEGTLVIIRIPYRMKSD